MVHKPEKFRQEEGENKMKSNYIHQSFLNESFGAFVDFAYRQLNHDIVVRINRCPVSGKKSAARPGRNLFLGIFLFNGEQ
jgi:hypothetical protein